MRIYGSQKEVLRFLIRNKPEFGKLSGVTVTGRESAIVTYEPPADVATTQDHFTYSVQNSLGVSAPAEVQLQIADKPPVLSVPRAADFPALLTGMSDRQTIEISNSGGGMAEGELEVDPPWRIEGSHKYHLGAGARQSFTILFAPESAGEFNSEVRYTSQRDCFTLLSGKANAALAVQPLPVKLKSRTGEAVRDGEMEIVNNTDTEAQVTLSGPDRLTFPKSLTIPAMGRATAVIQALASDAAEVREELQIEGAGVQLKVPVLGGPVGAILQVAERELHFPSAVVGQAVSGTLQVENVGAALGSWKWEAQAPFEVPNQPVRLGAGQKQEVTFRVSSNEPGRFRGWLKVAGEGQSLDVPVEALFTAGLGPARTVAAAGVREVFTSIPDGGNSSQNDSAQSEENHHPDLAHYAPLLKVREARASEIGPREVTLTWPKESTASSKFKLEKRQLSLDQSHTLRANWQDVPVAESHVQDDKMIAKVTGLAPGTAYTVRVLPVDSNGAEGIPFCQFQFSTLPPISIWEILAAHGTLLFFAAALLVIVFLGWWFIWRKTVPV